MNAMQKRLVVTPAIALLILSVASINMRGAFSNEKNGKIDLFTQKEPCSGKGQNVISDGFGFGEDVQIYALAIYDDEPVSNILVGFEILGPRNSFENFTLYRIAATDENGTAAISFRTPYSPESALGVWTIFGSAKIRDSVFNDSVKFKVDWIVEIVSINTINQNHVSQETFARASYMGIEIGLRSISMTPKTAYLTVAAYDALDNSINSTYLSNFVVPPNETIVYAYLFLYIPGNAHLGTAAVYAGAYPAPTSSNSLPYCPEVSKQFSIIARTHFLKVITVPVNIITIQGEGFYEENVSVPLMAQANISISAIVRYKFNHWGVDGISQGAGNRSIIVLMNTNHTATAYYTQITMYTLIIVRSNGGSTDPLPGIYGYPKGFSVTVTAIPNQNYIFDHWELNNVSAGSTNPCAIIMDRNQTLKAVFSLAPTGWFVPEWFFWPFLPLLILLILLLIIVFFYSKRRRNKTEAAFYSGWTAWYYGYDLRNRSMKFGRTSR
jgi:hypothetical protein